MKQREKTGAAPQPGQLAPRALTQIAYSELVAQM